MPELASKIWIIDDGLFTDTLERLGETRPIADQLACDVGVLIASAAAPDVETLFAHGADDVVHLNVTSTGVRTLLDAAIEHVVPLQPMVLFAPYERFGRSFAALLAVKTGWELISPALSVQMRRHDIVAMALDNSGRRTRQMVRGGRTGVD